MNKRYLTALLLLFIGLDTAFTFWQNYRLPLDGDIMGIVLPSTWYSTVLHDPFGWGVLTQHASYAAPNRFFVHISMFMYWRTVPGMFQHLWVSPINSLYAASTLFSTLTQVGLLLLLAAYVRQMGVGPADGWGFWVVVALLLPFFQAASGFYEQMGITYGAVTYTFFYSFAMLLLLGLLWPFYQAAVAGQPLQLPWHRALLLLLLMVVIAFHGPIDTATIAVLLLGIGGYWVAGQLRRWRQGEGGFRLGVGWLSGQAVGLLAVLAVLCVYSLYIGTYNSENDHSHSLGELYALLPLGVARFVHYQLGWPLLLLALATNAGLTVWVAPPSAARQRVLFVLGSVGLFVLAYLLLLPLGGYRSYRPNLLRNDTALPLTLALLFSYGLSVYFLLLGGGLRGRVRATYLMAVCGLSVFFLQTEYRGSLAATDTNDCERWAFDQLARAQEPVVVLSTYCTVLAWNRIDYPEGSVGQSELLYYWGITPTRKLYYQK